MHGQFIWYELTTPDVDAAKKFYPRFTGWGTQAFDEDYTVWTTGGIPHAGLFRLTDDMRRQGVPANWMPYVEAGDVDETVARATSLGGRVMHGPDDIPGTGRFAVMQDPQGAVFGVYKSIHPGGAWDGTPVVGRFSWHELMTTDYVAAFEFYRALFGWEKTGEMDMGGGQTYLLYGSGDKMYGGMYNRPPDMAGMHPFWLVYIHVKDVGKAVATATKAGAAIHRPQMDIPGGSIAILGDPQGAGFALHHASAPISAARPAAKKAAKTRVRKAKTRVRKAVTRATTGVRKATTKAATRATTGIGKATKKAATRARKAARTVTKAAKTAARKVKKAARNVAKNVRTAAKRGPKATPKKSPRRPATAATRPRRPGKSARKAASGSGPNARRKARRATRSGARRRS